MMSDQDAMDLLDQYRTSEEAAKQAESEDLLPTGTFEGQVIAYTVSVGDRPDTLFYGDPMARVQAELFNVEGKTRQFFFNATPVVKQTASGRMASASKALLQMAKATGTVGKSAKETLEAAKMVRLKYRVRKSDGGTNQTTGQSYEPGNWLDAVRAL